MPGCLSGSQEPLKNAFLRLSLYPLATRQELSMMSRKPGCYIYFSDAFTPWKVRKVTLQRTFKTVLRVPLQPYLNCLLQLKVSPVLLRCCGRISSYAALFSISRVGTVTSNALKPPSQLGLFKEVGDFSVGLSNQVIRMFWVFFLLNTGLWIANSLPG